MSYRSLGLIQPVTGADSAGADSADNERYCYSSSSDEPYNTLPYAWMAAFGVHILGGGTVMGGGGTSGGYTL